jgi:hypothetical protein
MNLNPNDPREELDKDVAPKFVDFLRHIMDQQHEELEKIQILKTKVTA